MQERQIRQTVLTDSFLYERKDKTGIIKFLKRFDFFSFVPVPKDEPVSTRRSFIASILFIILILIYILWDFVSFIVQNPPIIQDAQTRLDDQIYVLPRVGITFMYGQFLNESRINPSQMRLKMTKQLKDNSIKNDTEIKFNQNDVQYLKNWLGSKNINFYTKVLTPAEDLTARGLLYSTDNSNYSKISVYLCNLNDPQHYNCSTLDQIRKTFAGGRIFLFIQDQDDDSGIDARNNNPNRFRISNFFLVPEIYKRVTIQYQVVKTYVQPDYFTHFFERNYTRLQLYNIQQSISDVTPNVKSNQTSLYLLGINFQLAAQTLQVRVTYVTFLDHVAKWGAFFNVLFSLFAIFFLAHNRQKFYKKNPTWDRFIRTSKDKYDKNGKKQETEQILNDPQLLQQKIQNGRQTK